MWNWISNNTLITLLVFLFFLTLGYAIWLRFKMAVSKARFALASLTALVTCFLSGMSLISGSVPLQITNAILSYLGGATVPVLAEGTVSWFVGAILTTLVMVLIFQFSITTIRHWEGAVTVAVNDLAKECQDNNLALLAFAEFKRLALAKADPLASDVAVNWQQKLTEAPTTPPWHKLAKELFEAVFSEALFAERGAWRDRFYVWVGEVYISQSAETAPLLLFVFEDEPSDVELKARLDAYVADGASLLGAKVYAVYSSPSAETPRVLSVSDCQIEVWPRRALLRRGLKLTGYARDLIRRFDNDPLGGTTATLKDTFVEAHVARPGTDERRRLSNVLTEWLKDNSRRHLAITGEYGQGKSTAMLAFCVEWARRYLESGALGERIPLLIELRGKNPAEGDLLAAWAGRYGLPQQQLYNLIKAGEAIVVLEGFDELRNAGREYDRHEHFNALWRLAFPGTKLLFTGRPNFFLDDTERNRTLRADGAHAAGGNAFTEVWGVSRLTEDEIRKVANGFGEKLGESIIAATTTNPTFFDIVSRPSMLPVVATIWDKIENLRKDGYELTSGILLEEYLAAIYARKEAEIEKAELLSSSPGSANYILLPREVREVFSLAIVWKMVSIGANNTICRSEFNTVIAQLFDEVLKLFQMQGVPKHVAEGIRKFEKQFKNEPKADQLERVSSEVASAGLFVADPAGGASNLRLPHKQYYEYMIAKVAWIMLSNRDCELSRIFSSIDRQNVLFDKLVAEPLSMRFFSEIIENNLALLRGSVIDRIYAALALVLQKLIKIIRHNYTAFSSIDIDIARNVFKERRVDRIRKMVNKVYFTIVVPAAAFTVVVNHESGVRLLKIWQSMLALPGLNSYAFLLVIIPMLLWGLYRIALDYLESFARSSRIITLRMIIVQKVIDNNDAKDRACFEVLLGSPPYKFDAGRTSHLQKLGELICRSYPGILPVKNAAL